MAQIPPTRSSGNILSYFLSLFTPVQSHAMKMIGGFAATCLASYVIWRESSNLKLSAGVFFVGSAVSLALPSNDPEDLPLPQEELATATKTNKTVVSQKHGDPNKCTQPPLPEASQNKPTVASDLQPLPAPSPTLPSNDLEGPPLPQEELVTAKKTHETIVSQKQADPTSQPPFPEASQNKPTVASDLQPLPAPSPTLPRPQEELAANPAPTEQKTAVDQTPPHLDLQHQPSPSREPEKRIISTNPNQESPTTVLLSQEELSLDPQKIQKHSSETTEEKSPPEISTPTSQKKIIIVHPQQKDSPSKLKFSRRISTPTQFKELSPYKTPPQFENNQTDQPSNSEYEAIPPLSLNYSEPNSRATTPLQSRSTTPLQSPDGYHSSSVNDSESGDWEESSYVSPYQSPRETNSD